jgi:hypothetical protein
VTDAAGTVWSVFGAVRVQPGLVARDPATVPSLEANQGGYGNIAATASGQVWVSWFSPGASAADRGTFFQGIDPATGAPIGEKELVPGGGGAKAGPPRQPVAMTALQGGETSVLVAYPDSASKLVHVVDITSPDMHGLIPASGGASNIVLTADGTGRAWVVWKTPRNTIAALRFNKGATDIGATVEIRPPARTRDIWTLSANAQNGRLDIVGQLNVNRGAGNANTGTGAWHTQVLPGLTMEVSTTRVRRSTGGTVRFRVLDAGAPVRGARIRFSGRTLATNAAGRASLRIPAGARPGLRGATASKAGYTNSPTIGIRVVR